MSQLLIGQFFNELDRLRKISGTSRESVVREAFKDLLKAWGKQHELVFIPEYEYETPAKTRVYPDGALLYSLRVPLGYWEAKDEEDDLDREIDKKKRKGYPQDNIIYEDSRQAVLIQNRQEVLRVSYDDPKALERLLTLFFAYERAEIAEFRKAVEQFKVDLPQVLAALRDKVEDASRTNKGYADAETQFLCHARDTINPSVTVEDVREMLIQHILTEDIFARVFDDSDFHRQNNIAKELYGLEDKFFTGATKKNSLKQLEPYYAAIRTAASQIPSHAEKQTFLKVIYENFYKVYNPKAADRLGVIYTPNEIVRFMIEGADWLCEKHFGKNLIDKGVEILDPATGTGTFICELLEHFRGQKQKLVLKYKEELHANEVAILPYYVANLNIEATYAAISGQYAEFPNLCFVDTLDNVAGLGKFSDHQEELFGAMSEENVERIKRQNKRKISVIIGNPPYNANQQNENDNNKNRDYPRIDARIKATYIKESTAQKTKLYDMYARFFRWASDRINDEGIIAFVTNRGFLDKKTYDGFRKVAAREFDEIRVVELGGDWKTPGDGGGGNVFGIGTGVAISFLIRKKNSSQDRACKIFYSKTKLTYADDKLSWLNKNKISDVDFECLKPDDQFAWLNHPEDSFESELTLASKAVKEDLIGAKDRAIFKLFSLGVSTNRDEWVYDIDKLSLKSKMKYFISVYTTHKQTRVYPGEIKWSETLKRRADANIFEKFNADSIIKSAYRPFSANYLYCSQVFIDRLGNFDRYYSNKSDNKIICFTDPSSQKPWLVSSVNIPPDLHYVGSGAGTVCLPRYRYSSDGVRIDNITNWALDQFRTHYNKLKGPITKDDIFHYVYAVLHDPVYRKKYALNLKREFPRIPLYPDFRRWVVWGEKLIKLHIGYETVEPWKLKRIEIRDKKAALAGVMPKTILKADRENGTIVLDSETQLSSIPASAWDYRLGNRSALDWILDQYKEKTPRDPTIREKFNSYRFSEYKESVVDHLARVTRVSVETMEIIGEMAILKRT